MVGCLLISQGRIAPTVVEASEEIVGQCSCVFSIDCTGLNPTHLQERITQLIETEDLRDGVIIIVSLKGGSCWNSAALIAKRNAKVQVLAGLNLALVLSFVTKSPEYAFEELVAVMYRDGIRSIARSDRAA